MGPIRFALTHAGASPYVMSPELKKGIEALRQAAASQEQPGVDDNKQLPKVIKDMLGPFANQLSGCPPFRSSGFWVRSVGVPQAHCYHDTAWVMCVLKGGGVE